jgi:hypothetical protein
VTLAERLRQVIRVLPTAIVLWLGSRVFFDFVTRKPMFWSSKETWAELAWNGALFVPVMVFILVLAVHKYKPETNK